MRVLIIPDVHGRDFWKEPCSHIDEFDKVVFLGDYHDPYHFEVDEKTSLINLRDNMVPFVEQHRDIVVCLFGNHDANYLVYPKTSRYDSVHHEEIVVCLRRMNLQTVYIVDNYVFTHSGIVKKWLEETLCITDNYILEIETLNELPFDDPAFMQVSPYRGGPTVSDLFRFGRSSVGSCIWGDVREYRDSEKIPCIYQIFGHTQLHEEIIDSDFACLDCRESFVLDTETKELKKYVSNKKTKQSER